MPVDKVYFSNYSGNTKRFMERLDERVEGSTKRIPINAGDDIPIRIDREYVLFVPTYGGGNEKTAVPRQVREFLNDRGNRELLVGVVGFGNTNFGEHYCKAAEVISRKTGVPIIARVEIFGTDYDLEQVTRRLEILYGNS